MSPTSCQLLYLALYFKNLLICPDFVKTRIPRLRISKRMNFSGDLDENAVLPPEIPSICAICGIIDIVIFTRGGNGLRRLTPVLYMLLRYLSSSHPLRMDKIVVVKEETAIRIAAMEGKPGIVTIKLNTP